MKQDFESRCGVSLDDVRVHYHSDMPAKLGALAYTRGTQVHIGPGQEHCLRHELGHVVQQKTMAVPVTEYRDGIPVNTNPGLERGADALAGTAQLQAVPGVPGAAASPPAQLEDFHASVSLVPKDLMDTPFTADQLCIDTVKLTGRADTGLHAPQNHAPTQGAHTIADAFIKKYQKVLVRGVPIPEVLDFYDAQCQLLHAENDPDHWGNNPRVMEARTLSEAVSTQISMLAGSAPLPMAVWRKGLSRIISAYNTAYAHSILATTGVGTPGRGEAFGIKAIKNLKSPSPSGAVPAFFMGAFKLLIDTENGYFYETFDADTGKVSLYLHQRLFLMLSQLAGYSGYPASPIPDLQDVRRAMESPAPVAGEEPEAASGVGPETESEEESEATPRMGHQRFSPSYLTQDGLLAANCEAFLTDEIPEDIPPDHIQAIMALLNGLMEPPPLVLVPNDMQTEQSDLMELHQELDQMFLQGDETGPVAAITTLAGGWRKRVREKVILYLEKLIPFIHMVSQLFAASGQVDEERQISREQLAHEAISLLQLLKTAASPQDVELEVVIEAIQGILASDSPILHYHTLSLAENPGDAPPDGVSD